MLKIERLNRGHDRKRFNCGKDSLNKFLLQSARQHAKREISRTFVLVDDEDPTTILGYFTLIACEVIPANIPDTRLQKYPHPMPASKLVRLAVASSQQKKELARLMLIEAMRRTLGIAEHVGLIGTVVDAKDEEASAYYQSFGFIALNHNPPQLFLPMGTIQQLFE